MRLDKIVSQGDRVAIRLKKPDPAGGRPDYLDIVGTLEEANAWAGYLQSAIEAAVRERKAIEGRRAQDLLRKEQQLLQQWQEIQSQLKEFRPDEPRPTLLPFSEDLSDRPSIPSVIFTVPRPVNRSDPLAPFRKDLT